MTWRTTCYDDEGGRTLEFDRAGAQAVFDKVEQVNAVLQDPEFKKENGEWWVDSVIPSSLFNLAYNEAWNHYGCRPTNVDGQAENLHDIISDVLLSKTYIEKTDGLCQAIVARDGPGG